MKMVHVSRISEFLFEHIIGRLCLSIALIVSNVALSAEINPDKTQKISQFNQYQGYSVPEYDGWQQSSQYVAVRDGTRLAVEITRPTLNGELVDKPLPLIWTHTRYHRAKDGGTGLNIDWAYLETIVKFGYVVVAVDVRGSGASFGQSQGWLGPKEAEDAYDITEWLAAQPFSDGNIGMYGGSYLGITQYFAASQKPPHLKAIFPEMAWFDEYDFTYPGGIYQVDLIGWWDTLTKALDHSVPFTWFGYEPFGRPVRRVDGDEDGTLLSAAIADHNLNRSMVDMWTGIPFRDSVDPRMKTRTHVERSPGMLSKEISDWGGGMYQIAGWFDSFPLDSILWLNNTNNPQKLLIGPWFHTERFLWDMATEHIRWYDYWLKGIDNGIMDEPRVRYWTLGAPEGQQWRTSDSFPLASEKRIAYFFSEGTGGTDSTNDRQLVPDRPLAPTAYDDYTIDYTTSSGASTRWTNTYGRPARACPLDECGDGGAYPDMAENDRKALTYTTAPFKADTEITGVPVVNIWLKSMAQDIDIFVYLEEVEPDGKSNYLTEGRLRASHRRTAKPPYNFLGLPWHSSYEQDIQPLTGEPVKLSIVILPISNIVDAGNRIRVAITGADAGNFRTLELSPPPGIRLFRDSARPSHIELPIIPK